MQPEAREGLSPLGHEVEEVPLRNEGDELAARRKPPEVGPTHALAADLHLRVAHLLVRQPQEGVEQPQLGQRVHGRGMDGVAAEVAQEIRVLLQHRHVDARPRQQIARHHPGRPAAGDDALGVSRGLGVHGVLLLARGLAQMRRGG